MYIEEITKIEFEEEIVLEYVKNFENFNRDLSVNEFEKISLVKYIKGNTSIIKEKALYKFFEKSESFLKKFSQKFEKNVKNY